MEKRRETKKEVGGFNGNAIKIDVTILCGGVTESKIEQIISVVLQITQGKRW